MNCIGLDLLFEEKPSFPLNNPESGISFAKHYCENTPALGKMFIGQRKINMDLHGN